MGDWGDVCSALTGKYKKTFAVLNMANAYQPGGGYWSGCAAQEENMWYRSDAHMLSGGNTYQKLPPYDPPLGETAVIMPEPRVCFKGKEVRYPDGSVCIMKSYVPCLPFEFYELRSAGINSKRIRGSFDFHRYRTSMTRRIENQFQALKCAGIRHVIFGAIGCGVFAQQENATLISAIVCQIYQQMIRKYENDFDRMDFAIYHTGKSHNNFEIWKAQAEK
jgi:hypothetical protein